MVGILNTPSQLGCKKRRIRSNCLGLARSVLDVAGDPALKPEHVDLIWWQCRNRSVPGRVRIPAEDWQHLAFRHHCVVPSRDGIERDIQAVFDRQLLESEDVLLAL